MSKCRPHSRPSLFFLLPFWTLLFCLASLLPDFIHLSIHHFFALYMAFVAFVTLTRRQPSTMYVLYSSSPPLPPHNMLVPFLRTSGEAHDHSVKGKMV